MSFLIRTLFLFFAELLKFTLIVVTWFIERLEYASLLTLSL
jgi:hypothetical protein